MLAVNMQGAFEMANPFLLERLGGIQSALLSIHQAGGGMSNSSKGTEREHFLNRFLREVLPPSFRFGTGDITDISGNRSGQVDVVVEYPFLPSLPAVTEGPRLYLAEGVAAVIEVKSDVAAQWSEVEATAASVKRLTRDFRATVTMGGPGPERQVPVFAAGYKGWKKQETVEDHVASGVVDGILVIGPGIFVSRAEFLGIKAPGPWALWGLICCLHHAAAPLKGTSAHPLRYSLGEG